MHSVFKAPRRISVTVPCAIYDRLVEKSDDEGRSISNLAAYLLEAALAQPEVAELAAQRANRSVLAARLG